MKFVRRPRHSPHNHSFRRRPNSETSFALLAFLALLVGVILAGLTSASLADPPPVNDGYTVSAVVPGAVPTIPARIISPATGTQQTTASLAIIGTCQAGSLVKVFRGGVLAGAVYCNAGGSFNLSITLLPGANLLTALDYNALDQAGPATPAITIYYNVADTVPASPTSVLSPLTMTADNPYHGVYVGDEVGWDVTISGGLAPYAINIDWGDSSTSLMTVPQAGKFHIAHTYTKAPLNASSSYDVRLAGVDTTQTSTILQLTIKVIPRAGVIQSLKQADGGKLLVAWPILAFAIIMIASFWIGERVTASLMALRPLGRTR